VRDFARKNRLARAVVGASGGVDSSVVCAIAVEALGPDNVLLVAVPSRHTDPRSTDAARALARALGTRFEKVDLERLHMAAEQTLDALLPDGATAENVQARLRMTVLMAFVNREGGFLLNTSNKTELALGYGTLYGDLAGALYVLGDVHKPDVYELARFINRKGEIVPRFAVERPPSAELRPGQVDPFDYDEVAPRIESLLGSHRSDAALRRAEHKRRQAGVILRVSETSFGAGRFVPITRR
jgi:NAD+ synthase (glutamine-hydrolysing)